MIFSEGIILLMVLAFTRGYGRPAVTELASAAERSYRLGQTLEESPGSATQAIEAYRGAIASGGKCFADVHLRLGRLFQQCRQALEAEREFLGAIECNRNDSRAYVSLALLLQTMSHRTRDGVT